MTIPKLDKRTVNDILAQLKKKSEVYTPEWRMDIKDPDAGTALAQLFAEMFFDTVDRYNRFPDKCYVEFLNMLGVCSKAVSPSIGLANAVLVDGADESVYIKKGTQLFKDVSDPDSGDKRIVFETTAGFFATPADIRSIIMTDPVNDIITESINDNKEDFPIEMFHPDSTKNIERHRFGLAHNGVFRLNGKSQIRLKIENTSMSFLSEEFVSKLTNPRYAEWKFFSANGFERFSVASDGNIIVLTKNDKPLLATNENAQLPNDEALDASSWIFCDMSADCGLEEIKVDKIMLNSCSFLENDNTIGIIPPFLFANETELDNIKCGYCFGKEPSAYDSFFVCCDEAFSKSGAEIVLELNIATVIMQDNTLTDEEAYDYNQKLLIDKADAKNVSYDDIYISDVIWEYWNGLGWSRLDVSGTVNPFSCAKQPAHKSLSFTCPEDFAESIQNSHEGMWIRARVREVKNRYSQRGRWLLPLLKSISIKFDYGSRFLCATEVFSENNCKKLLYKNSTANMDMTLFALMPEKNHAAYFLFNKAPQGYPINLYFEFVGTTENDDVIDFEYLCGGKSGRQYWSELKAIDRTCSFSASGIISLFVPKDMCESELFGKSGFWIRAVNRSMQYNPVHNGYPKLTRVVRNIVEISQHESIYAEAHSIRAGKAEQSFTLFNHPVISCDVWVNEIAEIPLSQLREIADSDMSRVRIISDSNGRITQFWVKWEASASLSDSGSDDRHYELDAMNGVITFGDGVNGRIPAYRENAEISVDYSFGGGKIGNMKEGEIDGSIASIPYIESFTNISDTFGGSDEQAIAVVRKIGTKRLKHHGRAVTAEDFENLVLEEFNEVSEVRCFTNRNKSSQTEYGCTTVVVMPQSLGSLNYSSMLCRRIKSFLDARASCEMIKENKLSVIPATLIRVSSEITVRIDDYEYAAQIEQQVIKTLKSIIDSPNDSIKIGVMPRASSIITALRRIEHLSTVSGIMLYGEYYMDNQMISTALDDNINYRYFVATSGTHLVKMHQ